MQFAVSNIQLRDGEVTIDDQLLGKQHKVEKIQIDVPFIANLPADVDVFVQPLVQMVIDGSPLRIAGVAKPFQATRDSVVDLKLHRARPAAIRQLRADEAAGENSERDVCRPIFICISCRRKRSR